MTANWRSRAIVATVLWLLMIGALGAMQMGPNVAVLALVTAAFAGLVWLLLDLSDLAETIRWSAPRDVGGTGRGADPRVRMLHRQLLEGPGLDGGAGLHEHLVALVDHRLRVVHRIDRAIEPARAAAALPPELVRLVEGRVPAADLTDPHLLASIVSGIEAL